MLAEARRQFGERANVRCAQVDAMEIPYEAHSFDAVIANMMLYHVPDIDRALAQIRRVLKPDGWFACAMNGERGMGSFLAEVFADFDAAGKIQAVTTRFSLENGAQKLGRHFHSVRMLGRDDALDVTDAEDLVDYVLSLASMAQLRGIPRAQIRERFGCRMGIWSSRKITACSSVRVNEHNTARPCRGFPVRAFSRCEKTAVFPVENRLRFGYDGYTECACRIQRKGT